MSFRSRKYSAVLMPPEAMVVGSPRTTAKLAGKDGVAN